MMIKALIIVHLWTLVIAGGAWALQRDGKGPVGARFPAPHVWLVLIGLCILPGALYLLPFGSVISIPTTEAFDIISTQVSDFSTGRAGPLNFLAVYVGVGVCFVVHTLWQWARLQRLPLAPTAEPDIFTTPAALPPLTLSWPRRAVVMPQEFEARAALIRHERAHLRYHDAELTLLLLLLQDLMLRNPGMSFLVRQWRLSIELRADRAATNKLTASERKDYAALLLNIQRPTAHRNQGLPCPTARLNSTPHRNAKMRLVGIMEDQPSVRKHRWGAALLVTSVGASALGLTSAIATVNDGVIDMQLNPIDYAQKAPVQLPARCPGLKVNGSSLEEKELFVDGQLVPQQTILLGTVILVHDVRRDGSVYNPRTLDSTHPCFEENAKTSIVQWTAAQQDSDIRDAVVKLNFVVSGDTVDDIKAQLIDFFE